MNPSYDIVIFALSRAKHDYSSSTTSLAEQFAASHRVFLIDNPFTLMDVLRTVLKGRWNLAKNMFIGSEEKLESGIVAKTPSAVIPANFLPARGFARLMKLNQKKLKQELSQFLAKENVDRYVYINSYNPFYQDILPEDNKALVKIYYCVDEISESEYIQKHGAGYEEELMKKTDFTVCTSTELVRQKGKTAKESYLVQNGANIELFGIPDMPYTMPTELAGEERPKVLYVGNIDDRVDFDMLKKAIKIRSDMAFVFVGPTNSDDPKLKEIMAMENTLFLGVKPMEDVPAYLHNVQCTIIPFKRNKLTKSIYPLKINEYLAAGKPVVSTGFSADIKSFAGDIEISDEAEGFAQKLRLAVDSDSPEKISSRIHTASLSSWEARATTFLQIIDDYLKR